MSQQKQALVQPLVEELLNLVMKEGYMNQSDGMYMATPQMSPQIKGLIEKLKMKQM